MGWAVSASSRDKRRKEEATWVFLVGKEYQSEGRWENTEAAVSWSIRNMGTEAMIWKTPCQSQDLVIPALGNEDIW